MLVYIIRNRINGKVYVGRTVKTLARRWREHITDAQRGSPSYFHNAIRKYGPGAFEVALLSGYAETRAQLSDQERYFIAKYRSAESEFGYNLTLGGEGYNQPNAETMRLRGLAISRAKKLKNFHHSAETRKRISRSLEGRPGRVKSPEECAKIGRAHKDKPLSRTHRQALASSHEGKKLAPAHRDKVVRTLRPGNRQVA
jgi:group I intron endonuclease